MYFLLQFSGMLMSFLSDRVAITYKSSQKAYYSNLKNSKDIIDLGEGFIKYPAH